MSRRGGCGLVALVVLFLTIGCLVFAALAGGLVLTGEVPLYAPRLTGLEPEPNDAFRPTTPITLTFDQPMNPGSVEAAFVLEPAVPGGWHWNDEFTAATFVPDGAGYEPGTAYSVRLSSGAESGMLPLTTQRTVEWGFSLPPLADRLEPSLGADGLGSHPLLQAIFHYPLDCAATMRTFSISPDTVGVLACKDQNLSFDPAQPLVPDTDYVASLANVYLEGDPWARPGVSWEFQTAPALAVVEVTPKAAGVLTDLWSSFGVTFNRPVAANSVVSRFALIDQDGLRVPGQVSWELDRARFVFQPEEPLKPATQYRLVLERGIQDELGFELAEGLERQYTTPPMLGMPTPVSGSRQVALDSRIRVPFTGPMDRASVEAGLVISPALDVEMIWEEDTLVLVPRGGLLPDTTYQFSLDANIRDASGAPLAESRLWTLATQSLLLDAQVPSGAELTQLQQPIEFRFALPMDRASVQGSLRITPTTEGDLVWSDGDRTVTFQPDLAWQSGTNYEVAISGLARTKDRYQTLGEDRTYSFATAVAEIRFGHGANVQVMDAGGERTFQFVARGADVADFGLYAITPMQFLDLYSSGFRGIGPEAAPISPTLDLTPTLEWREALVPLSDQTYGEWQAAEAHIPAEVSQGMYVLSAEPVSEDQGQLLVVLTEHGLVLKRTLAGSGSQAQAQIVAWDTELGGGAPVVSATVRLYDRAGTLVAEGETGRQGLLSLDLPGLPEPLVALADVDGDVTVCGLGNEWEESGWWGWWDLPPTQPLYQTYSYTDRPIYRPGQDLFFKHIVRSENDADYTLPRLDLPVTVRLRDGRDNIAGTQVLTPTQFGTVFGEFRLADEPMLGTWHLETDVEGTISRLPVAVEEYRKPEYSVVVRTPQKTYVHGEAISVTVQADYYFGQPVSSADVRLLVYPSYPDEFVLQGEPRFGSPLFSEDGQIDEAGRWTITLPSDLITFDAHHQGRRAMLALEATVSDHTGQDVSSSQTIVVQPASQELTLVLEELAYLPNEEIVFSAAARDHDGEPMAGLELVAQAMGWDENEVTTAVAQTDEAGGADFSIRLGEQGWYLLRVTGVEDGGREMLAEDYVSVYDPTGQAPWYGGAWGAEPALSVSADQSAYAVGDEAQIVVFSPVAGPALLTLERGGTREAEAITLTAGANLISVPVRSDYAPNVYVTVNQFGPPNDTWWDEQTRPDTQLHKASTQLLVPMSERLLSVTLTSDQAAYGPGDEVGLLVEVLDQEGQPVSAEVSLAVVDEAIYALAEDVSQDPFDALFGPRPNLVRTFDSMRPTRWLFPEAPGMGGGGEEEGGVPRTEFLDTAYWAPSVITDEQGEAQVTIQLPDNLTEWRILARAITTDTLVGQATTRLGVSQDIVVRPVVPRFLLQGDSLSMEALVHNFTAQPVSATVQVDLEGLVLEGDASQVLHVPANGAASAAWPVRAEEPGDAQVKASVTAWRGARVVGRDVVGLSLPVQPMAVTESSTWAGELSPGEPAETITLTVPGDVVTGLSSLEITLAPSLVPDLFAGLEYLVGYPYGCVEQTMSRALPNAMVARALGELGLRNERLEADLPPLIAVGLQKLYGYQHNDGGWGWWYDDDTDVNQTAYVVLGLAMTEQAGYEVDAGVLERGGAVLKALLPTVDPRAQAYGVYALVMAGQPVSITTSLTDALTLDLFSQAALAVALDMAGDEAVLGGSRQEMVAALVDNLLEKAVQDDGMVHWEEESEEIAYSRTVMGSSVRTTAMVVDALVRLEPESLLLPGAVRWLMAQRQGDGWGDTQKTSYAILSLTNYLVASRGLAAGSAYRVYLNGELWEVGVLDQADQGERLTVPITALLPAENHVQLELGEEVDAPSGRLYYGVTLSTARAPEEESIPALDAGGRSPSVRREYRLQDSEEPATQFQPGDLVEVRLILDVPEEGWHVVVHDPLPAGFEALNERLGTTSHIATAYQEPHHYWQDHGYNRKEVRDEQVSFFITRLNAGEQTLSYLMRAINSGDFGVPPAQVYFMYEPEVWSRSDSTRCQVEAR